jgi:ribulose-5-phosphate 4-epimerase/fuculose-1-phosphate aldolase
MSPSGVQKVRMKVDDMFVVDREGSILSSPIQHPDRPKLTLSQCSPLFLACFNLRNAGAAIHTHSMDAALLTMLIPGNFLIIFFLTFLLKVSLSLSPF